MGFRWSPVQIRPPRPVFSYEITPKLTKPQIQFQANLCFRRGFVCNLHHKGLFTLNVMYLGGGEDLDMMLKYTRSITFEDCLEHYKAVA